MYTLIFFSLAGLLSGFAFGGFFHPHAGGQNGNLGAATTSTPLTVVSSTATPTATPEVILPLNIPKFQPYPSTSESLSATTSYTVGIQVVNKQDQAVSANDITCKVWLVQQIPANQILSIPDSTLKTVSDLASPITGTINNQPVQEVAGLNFDPTTPQTALCNANGTMTWKYTLQPTLAAGTYDMVILADWKGVHYNWSWVNITVGP
jgi:hypothetical protein